MSIRSDKDQVIQDLQNELTDLRKEFEEFTYIVSHDLRAPLTTIEGFSSLITHRLKDNADTKIQRDIKFINKSVEEAKDMINALLVYSRINTHEISITSCDIAAVIRDITHDLAELINQTQASITYTLLPTIQADKELITQCFQLLIQNALTYQHPKSIPTINIDCNDKQSHWEFTVSDNGIGIKPEHHERIFKFLRRAVTQDSYPGLGAGLSYVQNIVKRHGGDVWVMSAPNKGTTFGITIKK